MSDEANWQADIGRMARDLREALSRLAAVTEAKEKAERDLADLRNNTVSVAMWQRTLAERDAALAARDLAVADAAAMRRALGIAICCWAGDFNDAEMCSLLRSEYDAPFKLIVDSVAANIEDENTFLSNLKEIIRAYRSAHAGQGVLDDLHNAQADAAAMREAYRGAYCALSYVVGMTTESCAKMMKMDLDKWDKERPGQQLLDRLAKAEAIVRADDRALSVLAKSPEINPSNYDHDQVCELNAALCEALSIMPPARAAAEAAKEQRR